MRKSLSLLCLALAVTTASRLALASPQRGTSAAKNLLFTDDSAPVNLWVWPDAAQTVRRYYGPRDVWIPETGIWYIFAGAYGYIDTNPKAVLLDDFSANSVTARFDTGYSAAAFLILLPGDYRLSCTTDGRAQFRIGFYEEVEGGFKWHSASILSASSSAGVYERVFTVPDGCSLVVISPTSSQRADPPLTVSDIALYRID